MESRNTEIVSGTILFPKTTTLPEVERTVKQENSRKKNILPSDHRLQSFPNSAYDKHGIKGVDTRVISSAEQLSSVEDYIRPQYLYIDGVKHIWCSIKEEYVVLARRSNKKNRKIRNEMDYSNPNGSFQRYLKSVEKVDYVVRKKQRNKKMDMLAGASMIRDVEGKVDREIAIFEKKNGRKACVEDMLPMFATMELHSDVPKIAEKTIAVKQLLAQLTATNPLWKVLLNFMEDLALTSIILYDSVTVRSRVAAVIAFLKLRTGTDIATTLLSFIYELVKEDDMEVQTDYMFLGKEKTWKSFTHMGIFPRIASLMSLMVTVGLMPAQEFKIAEFKVFSAEAMSKQKDAKDIVDCALETMLYFMECGNQLYKANLVAFLKGEKDALSKLDDDIVHLISYLQPIKNGNYEYLTGNTIASYHDLIMSSKSAIKTLIAGSKHDKVMSGILQQKLQKLSNIEVEYEQSKPLDGMRGAPYCISIFGPSAMGKSSVVNILTKNILVHNKYPSDDKNYCTLQPDDKFYSTMRSDTTCVILDDVANTVTDKANVNPADRVILLVNNIPYFAPRAIAEEKGKIQVRPKLVALTTNIKNINAGDWSQEPVSVLRRMNVVITVKVRPIFQDRNKKLDINLVNTYHNSETVVDGIRKDDVIPDAWLLSLEEIAVHKPLAGPAERFSHIPVIYNKKVMVDVSIYEAIECLNYLSTIYYIKQDGFVKSQKELGQRISTCSLCCKYLPLCECENPDVVTSKRAKRIFVPLTKEEKKKEDEMEIQSGLTWIGEKLVEKVYNNLYSNFMELWNIDWADKATISGMTDLMLFKYTHNIVNNPFALVNYVPDAIKDTEYFQYFYLYWKRGRTNMMVKWGRYLVSVPFIFMNGVLVYKRAYYHVLPMSCLWLTAYGVTSAMLFDYSYRLCTEELSNRTFTTLVDAQNATTAWNTFIIGGVSIATAVLAVKVVQHGYQAYLSSIPESQGNLSPSTPFDVDARDKQTNVWSHAISKPFSDIGTNDYTHDQLRNVISGNCMFVEMRRGDVMGTTGGIFLCSNIIMVPYHFVCPENNVYNPPFEIMELCIYRADRKTGGSSRFIETIHGSSVVRIGSHDLCIISIHAGGTFTDIVKFIDVPHRKCQTTVVFRDSDGLISNNTVATFTPGEYLYEPSPWTKVLFKGGSTNYNFHTKKGMCIAAHISKTVGPRIVGFHVAGFKDTCRGFSLSPSQEEIRLAIKVMHTKNGTLELHSNGVLAPERYGKSLGLTDDVSPKAPVSYIPRFNFTLIGSIGSQATYFSEVKTSMLARHVSNMFGMQNKWGKPEFKPHYLPWYNSLIHIAEPRCGLPAHLLKKAADDYIAPLLAKMEWYKKTVGVLRPLTDHEVLNGVHGVRFVDGMKFKSSAGFPIGGAKSKLVQGPEGSKSWKDPDLILNEFETLKSTYLRGERYYPIFKACLKDEPTLIGSGKVRVFFAGDMMIQYALRKYTLGFVRLLSIDPLLSEIAVGINCYSSEWQQLIDHITHKGERNDTILAGDYSKWDLRLPAQLVSMAFNIIIRLAQASGNYTDEDIMIMRGLATDVVYFMCNYNGSFFMVHGGMASGHTLTAHLNSICNALLVRMGFFNVYPNCTDFRMAVHLILYGDDFMGGVSKEYHLFNFLSYKEFLSSFNMIITPPRKKDEPKKYLTLDETDFLKRRSVFIPEISHSVGALELDSLFKSLYCRGKLEGCSKEEHAESVLRGFKRELFCHGKKVFDDLSPKLIAVAKEVNLHIPLLERDFQHFVDAWLEAENGDAGAAHMINTANDTDDDYSEGAVLDLYSDIYDSGLPPKDPDSEGNEL